MRPFRLLTTILSIVLFSQTVLAQWGDCSNSISACTNPSFSVTPNGSGNDIDFTTGSTVSNPQTNPNSSPGNSGCLQAGELNSTWIVISVSQGGTLEFSMGTAGSFNCFDWIMWPYDANTCSGIQGNTLPPVSCNWNGACTGITGMSNPGNIPSGGDPSDFENPISVNAGDQFIVCFSNYSSASTNVPLDFFGSAQVTCGSVTNPTICYGETAEINVFDGVSYTWDTSTPGFINATGNSAFVNPTVTTDYDVTITYFDGTTQVVTSTVTVFPQITPTATATQESCPGASDGSITVTAPNAVAPINYALSGAGTGTNSSGTFSNLGAGSYTINVTDANGCTGQTTVSVGTGSCCSMVLNVTSTTIDCNGVCNASATVDTTGTIGAATIQWYLNGSPIAGGNGLTISNLCADSYSVEVTDATCTVSATEIISEPTVLTATSSTTPPLCAGENNGQIVISASGGTSAYSYSIDGGNNFQANGTFSNLSANNYSIIIEDANGCSITENVTLADGPACCNMILNLTSTTIDCFGNCNASATVDTSGTTGIGTISWRDNNGNPIGSSNALTISSLCAGTYSVEVVDPACTLTQNVTITEPSELVFTTNSSDIDCFGNNSGQIVINASGGTSPYSFSNNNGVTFQSSNTFDNLNAGTYPIVVEDANGCQKNSTINIAEPQELTLATAITDNTCNQVNAPCNGQITTTVSGGAPAYTYLWSNGASTNQITNVCAGNYAITVTDENGCSVTLTNISVAEPPAVTINNIIETYPLCNNDCNGSILINSSSAITFSIDNGSSFSPSGDFQNLCAGDYSIVAMDANGCIASATSNLSNPEVVNAEFIFFPDSALASNPVFELTASTSHATGHYWYYVTTTNDTVQVNETNPTLHLPESAPGIYEACLVAYDNNFCFDTTCHSLVVGDEFYIFVPNSFSPNDDGLNDVFYPVVNHYDVNTFEFFIFNKWGQLIFKSDSPDKGWDGTHLSLPVPVDTYVWKIKTKTEFDKAKKEFIGHVNLFR